MGDHERERTALALRRHYLEGRLDENELSERLELALQARSRSDLRVALGQLPRWPDFPHLAERARHGAIVAVATTLWLMLSAALFVGFLVWVVAEGATLGGLIAFPFVWIVLSVVLYRWTVVSRRRLNRR